MDRRTTFYGSSGQKFMRPHPEPPRVLVFAGVDPESPTFFRRVCLIAKHLLRNGCSMRILCLSRTYYSMGKPRDKEGLTINYVGQYHYDGSYNRLQPFAYVSELLRISIRSIRAIRRFRPQAVHIFSAHPSSLVLLAILRIFGYKVYIDLDDLNSAQVQTVGYSKTWVRTYSFLERFIPRLACKVTVCSRFLQERYPGSLLMPNMYDNEEFTRLPPRKKRRKRWTEIVYLGTMGAYHGEKAIIEWIPRVLTQEKKIRFVFIGGGEGEGEARALAGRLKAEQHVRFTGPLPYKNVLRLLSRSDIGLLYMEDTAHSRARHPLKLIDFMASGVCCIASDVGEAGHYIKDGINGVLVPSGDVEGFIVKIAFLSRHPEISRRIGQRAKKAITLLEVNRHIHRWKRLYEQ